MYHVRRDWERVCYWSTFCVAQITTKRQREWWRLEKISNNELEKMWAKFFKMKKPWSSSVTLALIFNETKQRSSLSATAIILYQTLCRTLNNLNSQTKTRNLEFPTFLRRENILSLTYEYFCCRHGNILLVPVVKNLMTVFRAISLRWPAAMLR